MDIDLKGLSFQEQKELLLLKKELLELEQNKAYVCEQAKMQAQQDQILLEYEVWDDYINWLAKHGVWWENSDPLNALKYAQSSSEKYKGIIPKYPTCDYIQEIRKNDVIQQHGKDIKNGLNNVAIGCNNIANATIKTAIATNPKAFKSI